MSYPKSKGKIKSLSDLIGRQVVCTIKNTNVQGIPLKFQNDCLHVWIKPKDRRSFWQYVDRENKLMEVHRDNVRLDDKSTLDDLIGLSVVCQKQKDSRVETIRGKVLSQKDGFYVVQVNKDVKDLLNIFLVVEGSPRKVSVNKSHIIEVISEPMDFVSDQKDHSIGERVICFPKVHNYHGAIKLIRHTYCEVQIDDTEDISDSIYSKNSHNVLEVPKSDIISEKKLCEDLINQEIICKKPNRTILGRIIGIKNGRYMVMPDIGEVIPAHLYFNKASNTILAEDYEIHLKTSEALDQANLSSNEKEADNKMEVDDDPVNEIPTNYEGFSLNPASNINHLMALCDIYSHGHSTLAIIAGSIIYLKEMKPVNQGFCCIKYVLHKMEREIYVPKSTMPNNFTELSDEEYSILIPIQPNNDRVVFYDRNGLDFCKLLTVGKIALVTSRLIRSKTECIIRYKGTVDGREGTFYGVELLDSLSIGEDKPGHCDGKQYFQTNRKSLFVTANQLFENSKVPFLSFKEGDIVKWKNKDLESAVDIGCITSIDVRPGNSAAVIRILGMHTPVFGFVERDNAKDALQTAVVPLHELSIAINLLPSVDTVIGRAAQMKLDPKFEPVCCTIIDVHSSSDVIIETETTLPRKYQHVKNTKVYGTGKENRIVIVPYSLLNISHVLEYEIKEQSMIKTAVKNDLESKKEKGKSGDQKPSDNKNSNLPSESPVSRQPTSHNSVTAKPKTEIKNLQNQHKKYFETIEFNDGILKNKNLKLNDPIIIQLDNENYLGRLKWSGIVDKFGCVGVELDDDVSFGTDGTFQHLNVFECKDKRGVLLPLHFAVKNNNIVEEEDEEKSSCPYDSSFYKSLKPVETDDKLNKLTVDSLVTVNLKDNLERQGSVKYIGISDLTDEMLVGVELDYLSSLGNDGVFDGVKLFECNPGCGVLVPLDNVKPDDRFDKAIEAEAKKIPLPEYYDRKYSPEELKQARALSSVKDKSGPFRGIQGCYNSCYMDSTIYAMFAFNSCFDNLINRPNQGDKRIKELQQLLADTIVAPLRCEHHFVNSSMMLEFRSKLETFMTEKRQQSAGFQYEEKDPEEFLNCLFGQLFNCDQFLKFDNSQEGFMYQVFLEEGTLKKENPSTQELLQISLSSNCAKFKQPPSTLILLLPRHGRDYRMFSHVILSPEIDLTYLLTNDKYSYPCGGGKRNFPCDKSAAYQCLECTDAKGFSSELVLCKNCWRTSPHDTKGHKKFDLKTDNFLIVDSPKLELFAVLSIETSHYVAFVKTGKDKNSKWVLFDSMAVRKGEMNVPEVTVIPEISDWLAKPDSIRNLTTKRSVIQKRLFCDTYMCFYRNPDLDIYG